MLWLLACDAVVTGIIEQPIQTTIKLTVQSTLIYDWTCCVLLKMWWLCWTKHNTEDIKWISHKSKKGGSTEVTGYS